MTEPFHANTNSKKRRLGWWTRQRVSNATILSIVAILAIVTATLSHMAWVRAVPARFKTKDSPDLLVHPIENHVVVGKTLSTSSNLNLPLVYLAKNHDICQKMMNLIESNELQSFSDLCDRHDVVGVRNPSLAKVIRIKDDSCLIEIIDGFDSGVKGWISVKQLVLPENDMQ